MRDAGDKVYFIHDNEIKNGTILTKNNLHNTIYYEIISNNKIIHIQERLNGTPYSYKVFLSIRDLIKSTLDIPKNIEYQYPQYFI